MKLASLLIGLAMALPFAASSGASRSVAISGFAFAPATLFAEAGDTVTWTNKDNVIHTVTCDVGSCAFGSPDLGNGGTFATTLAGASTQSYHCAFHANMHGKLYVGSGLASAPDLMPDATSLAATRPLVAGAVPDPTTARVSVVIRNVGGAASGATSVEFRTTNAAGADVLIGTAALGALSAGGSATVGVDWNNAPIAGNATVRVVADPANTVVEGVESNDIASGSVHVGVV